VPGSALLHLETLLTYKSHTNAQRLQHVAVRGSSRLYRDTAQMVVGLSRQALLIPMLMASAAALGAALAPIPQSKVLPAAGQGTGSVPIAPAPAPQVQQISYLASPHINSTLAQWRILRNKDGHPFSSYASFLTRYGGWPGESGLRRSAERAINPAASSPAEVTAYFRIHPALTAIGHARHALTLQTLGQLEQARQAARQAWHAGVLPRFDEDRLLSQFGSALTPQDHDRRMEALLAKGDTASAQRTLPYSSSARRPLFDARIALQTQSPDAAAKVAMLGSSASTDAGVLADRVNWLRNSSQTLTARNLLAQRPVLTSPAGDAESWLETLLTMARGAANDKQWSTAYAISSKLDDAFPPATEVSGRSLGERDDYTSLAWLAGSTALHQLGRPADAIGMFTRYAKGGRSAQVITKGYYWAGRAAQAAGRKDEAATYFNQAAAYPELFYGQLALERVGRIVPAPAAVAAVRITDVDRAAFQRREVVQATHLLGLMGQWEDQSVFVRALAEGANTETDRALAAELAGQTSRPDLGVWIARVARNEGSPFYVQGAFPQVQIPPAQSAYWSLAHGIIRQESSFDRAAVSHAGARGMMQLMPGTGREVASKLGLPYDQGRLTRDPNYNILLGSHYFQGLMNYWGNNAALAAASYNAGPGNVRKWITQNGDPRLPGADIVKWIEDIPFLETRGYVQRVLENAVVYDAINPARAGAPKRVRLSHYLGKTSRPG
jgi:soluble lytic murein transglycosylase